MAQYFMWFPKLFIFLLIILILVSIFKKVRKIILLEIRIRRYSVHDLKDDISFMDKLDEKYYVGRIILDIIKNGKLYAVQIKYSSMENACKEILENDEQH